MKLKSLFKECSHLLVVAVLLGGAGTTAAQPSPGENEPEAGGEEELGPREIVDRALDTTTLGFQEGEFRIAMFIREDSGHERQRVMSLRSRHTDDDLNRALVRLVSPAEVAGQSYLFLEDEDQENEIWIFLPALDDAPRRISGSQRNQGFLGSNITYTDLDGKDLRHGDVTRVADEELAGHPVYVVDVTREGSQYGRIRLWVRHSDFVPLRIRYFDTAGETEKTLFTEQVGESQDRIYVSRSSVVARDESSTTTVIESLDFEAVIDMAEFTVENLARQ